MTNEEIFDQWCPVASRWSTWAKPVLFAQPLPLELTESLRNESDKYAVNWPQRHDSAVVIDLPGIDSIALAVRLAREGYQPVPLFNCCAAPDHEVLPTSQIRSHLVRGANDLRDLPLPSTASPAFILDSDRTAGKNIPRPGEFDNRWMTFPQDFPSGLFLKESGINQAILIQSHRKQPALDLAQVVMRWQEAGIAISVWNPSDQQPPSPLTVVPPPRYRWFFQRTLALLGFRRNSAGGFGSVIPEPGGGGG